MSEETLLIGEALYHRSDCLASSRDGAALPLHNRLNALLSLPKELASVSQNLFNILLEVIS